MVFKHVAHTVKAGKRKSPFCRTYWCFADYNSDFPTRAIVYGLFLLSNSGFVSSFQLDFNV